MNERIRYVEKESETIFLIDLKDLSGNELLEHVLHTCVEFESINKETLFLIDITNTNIDLESFNYLYRSAKTVLKYSKRSAMVGSLNGMVKKFFKLYIKLTGSSIRLFMNEADAYNYLKGK